MATTMNLDVLPARCEPPPLPAAVTRPRRKRPVTLEPGRRIGGWRIDRELGRGGMATVYAVAHTKFGKRAALKLAHRTILGPDFTPETFLREARVANLINHAGVAEVFATGTFDGRPYMAMERLAGRSLGARLDEGGLSRDESLAILIELCGVLAAAHAAGVIHRDLKLDNVLLLDEPYRDGCRVKLLDWGVARIVGEPDPLSGLVVGTLTCVAPEQLRGGEITPAADIYGLAVLAYQLLLGQSPFASRSDLELIHKHMRDEPPRPHTLWAEIPPALDAILFAMLAKQPERRPALADIVQVLRDARVQARQTEPSWFAAAAAPPPPPLDVLGRPVLGVLAARHGRIAAAALGVALTLASLGLLFTA